MAAYPSLPQSIGSRPIDDDGTILERSVSGKPRLRAYYTQNRKEFVVVHEVTTTDNRDTLLNHWAGDRVNQFNFVFAGDGVTYEVRYVGHPSVEPLEGNFHWKITNRLVVM